MVQVINIHDLPPGGTSWRFDRYLYGDVNVSFFFNETPHKFINSGSVVARHLDIHTRPRMITDWLETE